MEGRLVSQISDGEYGQFLPRGESRLMDPRIFVYTMIGLGIAAALVLEKRLQNKPLSLPILFVALGWAVFSLPLDYGWLHPAFDTELAAFSEYMTEAIVIISLVGLGISIDRKFTWKGWKQVAPLLWFTMPVCIAGVALMGWSWLGLAPAGGAAVGSKSGADGSGIG